MRKQTIVFSSIFVIFFWGIIFLSAYFRGQIHGMREYVRDQNVEILALKNQVPTMAKYIILVKAIMEKANDQLSPQEIVEVARVITEKCHIYRDLGLTPAIVMALIERESGFNPQAISLASAYGLTQVLLSTAEIHAETLGLKIITADLLLDPVISVEIGIEELVRLRKAFLAEKINSWPIVLTAYYWGFRNTMILLTEKKRAMLPSMEYGVGVIKLANQWEAKGI